MHCPQLSTIELRFQGLGQLCNGLLDLEHLIQRVLALLGLPGGNLLRRCLQLHHTRLEGRDLSLKGFLLVFLRIRLDQIVYLSFDCILHLGTDLLQPLLEPLELIRGKV